MADNEPQEKLKAAKTRMAGFAGSAPALMKGFSAVSTAASRAGHFSVADRELMAVAISVTMRCDDCVLYHVDAAKRHGATEAMLIEALEVAVEMGGGPAVMYSGKALEAFRAF